MILTITRNSMLFFLLLLLASCSTFKHKDGPPRFYVDMNRVHNAVPKKEPLSKYGNMPSYQVFGKRYYTLKSSTHYDRVGVASWYGMQFHNHRTSSGEPYNVLQMTAAHKTLPLPTYAEVTNLANQRKVIVKINDRGPFEANRLIDLSYVAARKLGMLGHGTAMVRVRAINFDTPIYLTVGHFADKAAALRLKKRLTPILHAPLIITMHKTPHPHLAKSTTYRMMVGPIRDTALANRIQSKLKHLGLS